MFLIFFAVWCTVIALGFWYSGRRIINNAQLTGRARTAAWSITWALFLLPQVPFFLFMRGVQAGWVDVLSLAGYLVLGFFALALTFFLIRDGVLYAIVGTTKVHSAFKGTQFSSPVMDSGRRRFIVHASNLSMMGLAAAASSYGFFEARRRGTFEMVEIPLKSLPFAFDGFRILQFSDLHAGPTIKRNYVEAIAKQVMDAKPDLIAFTGDLVDGSVAWLKDDVAPLKDLAAPFGKYFVTGNHEYYSGAEQWVQEAQALGFDVLLNEHRTISKGSERIILAGITDYGAGDFMPDHRSDPPRAMAGVPAGVTTILLAHQPRSVEGAAKAGFNLQLSGHTHGGQFFPGNYLARLNQPYISGLHKHGEMWIYVNRGIGYWGPPLRLGAPPELTVITLRRVV